MTIIFSNYFHVFILQMFIIFIIILHIHGPIKNNKDTLQEYHNQLPVDIQFANEYKFELDEFLPNILSLN